MGNNTTRDPGLDIVRILAMIGIVVVHIIGHGGILNACVNQRDDISYWFAYWIDILAYTSVDCFGLLSGYLGLYRKKNTCYRLLELICIAFVYCIVITIVFKLMIPSSVVGVKSLLICLFPIIDGRYWYITCYIPLALLQPYINKSLLTLDEKEHRRLSILIIIVFGFLQSAVMKDLFAFNTGYSFVWLLCLYIIGSYIKRVDVLITVEGIRLKSLFVLLICSLILLGGNVLIETIFHRKILFFVNYISPIILVMSACVIFVFRDLPILRFNKLIAMLSLVTYDVYLFHCHILVHDSWILEKFGWIANSNVYMLPVYIIISALLIYGVSSIVGIIRHFVFKTTKLDVLIKYLSFKLDQLLYVNAKELK